MEKEEMLVRIERYIDDRYIKIDNVKCLRIKDTTAKEILNDILKSDDDYYDYDDFRSRT